jgi:hypothetical protein
MKLRRAVLGSATAALLAVGAIASTASPASADYGPGATYQVEISSNITGPNGGGVWLWLGLHPSAGTTTSGTGDYAGSDCGHGLGAAGDRGDVTWTISEGVLTISGVVLNGLQGLPVTVVVPAGYGHYRQDVVSVFPELGPVLGLPSGFGFSQIQVAP